MLLHVNYVVKERWILSTHEWPYKEGLLHGLVVHVVGSLVGMKSSTPLPFTPWESFQVGRSLSLSPNYCKPYMVVHEGVHGAQFVWLDKGHVVRVDWNVFGCTCRRKNGVSLVNNRTYMQCTVHVYLYICKEGVLCVHTCLRPRPNVIFWRLNLKSNFISNQQEPLRYNTIQNNTIDQLIYEAVLTK